MGRSLLLVVVFVALTAGRIPRDPAEIMAILSNGPHAGDCGRCHTEHAGESTPQPHALLGPDDNSLCDGCHATPWAGGSYPGTWSYNQSAHGSDPMVIWPGPVPQARSESMAAGKCVNCHDPHGWSDAGGGIPQLQIAREENLCLTCHDGSPASANIKSDAQRAYRHPTIDYTGRHTGPGEILSSDFAASPVNRRHAECVDCHNPHVARSDPGGVPPIPPGMSARDLGVSRIRVLNGAAGFPPTYQFIAASDSISTPLAEYQLCFKCHSSWTIQPTGQTDLALVLNTSNPSFHPVEGPGRNLNIPAGAFVTPWTAASLTECGDCHGSDTGLYRGPHGSSYRYILSRPYTASSSPRHMTSDEICFSCHSYDVYANPSSPDVVLANSRFNTPGAGKGHAQHVGEESATCYSCHTTHGSPTLNHLLVIGRNPGILTYTETATGGTCSPTCHGSESYTVNYAR